MNESLTRKLASHGLVVLVGLAVTRFVPETAPLLEYVLWFVVLFVVLIAIYYAHQWRPALLARYGALTKPYKIITCVAGIALLATLVISAFNRDSRQPTREAASKKEAETIAESLRAIIPQAPTGDPSMRYPGFSVHSLIRINDVKPNRPNYLFDAGGKEKDRFSVYVNSNQLTAALVDSNGGEHRLNVPLLDTNLLGSVGLLTSEFGIGDGRAFMRIVVNASAINSRALPTSIEVGKIVMKRSDEHSGMVIGSDLNFKNGAVFDMFFQAVYSTTCTSEELRKILAACLERLRKPVFLRFSGDQFAHVPGKQSQDVVPQGD